MSENNFNYLDSHTEMKTIEFLETREHISLELNGKTFLFYRKARLQEEIPAELGEYDFFQSKGKKPIAKSTKIATVFCNNFIMKINDDLFC